MIYHCADSGENRSVQYLFSSQMKNIAKTTSEYKLPKFGMQNKTTYMLQPLIARVKWLIFYNHICSFKLTSNKSRICNFNWRRVIKSFLNLKIYLSQCFICGNIIFMQHFFVVKALYIKGCVYFVVFTFLYGNNKKIHMYIFSKLHLRQKQVLKQPNLNDRLRAL